MTNIVVDPVHNNKLTGHHDEHFNFIFIIMYLHSSKTVFLKSPDPWKHLTPTPFPEVIQLN